MRAVSRSPREAAHTNSKRRTDLLTKLFFNPQNPDQLVVLSSVEPIVMISSAGVMLTVSSFTAISLPTSCTAWQYMEIASVMAGFVFDTVLSFDALLIFLVGSIAVALFAFPILTIALGSTLIMVALSFYRMHEAHSAFMALGPGLALPSSGSGFWRAIQIARRRADENGTGFLDQMSPRNGPTPYTFGTTMHEQISQRPLEDVQQYFTDRLALFAATRSDDSKITSSSSRTTASIPASSCDCISSPDFRAFGCSVCCPQRSNCGAHVILHPADLEKVISTGHGEIHPLANPRSPFSRSRGNSCLPGTLALVYAPREYSEVCTVMRIIEAGAMFLESIDGESL